jgi:hypothetical protein
MPTTLHDCDNLRTFLKGDKGTYFTIKQAGERWSLTIIRCASPQEVVMGEAENIGEQQLNYTFLVQFCPFCGQKLDSGPT